MFVCPGYVDLARTATGMPKRRERPLKSRRRTPWPVPCRGGVSPAAPGGRRPRPFYARPIRQPRIGRGIASLFHDLGGMPSGGVSRALGMHAHPTLERRESMPRQCGSYSSPAPGPARLGGRIGARNAIILLESSFGPQSPGASGVSYGVPRLASRLMPPDERGAAGTCVTTRSVVTRVRCDDEAKVS